ncbi:DUF4097 family beta strand repeat-containing protein [Streptomyces sp. NPDC048629]|uniref:DUF4097 family beta strand repeat-containing protein n=1 Tax=Streptomyces sp. NPDC048629 TaxID=3154824 RepID=UPI0034289ABE
MQKFATTAAISVVLDIPAGHIRFIAADRADTTVEVRPENAGKSKDVKVAEQTVIGYDNGVLRIETPEARNAVFGHSGAVEVTVQLPAGSSVEAKAAAAEFRGVGRLGDVVFEGGHRSVKLDEAASARLSSHDGNVVVGRLTGPADITTQLGDVEVLEAHGGNVTLSTQKGNITVVAARGVSATLDAGTSYGRVSNALVNSGDAALAIRATTSYGDISARSL